MEIYAILKVNDKGIVSKDLPILFHKKEAAKKEARKLGKGYMIFEASKWDRVEVENE